MTPGRLAAGSHPYSLSIGGENVATDEYFPVVNPATGRIIAEAPECTDGQLDDALRAARDAQRTWGTDESQRRHAMSEAATVIRTGVETLAAILTAEQGKPLHDAAMEIENAAARIQYYANLNLPRQIIRDSDSGFVEIRRRPLGVVAAITPWNYPISLAMLKIAPALLAGNTVVLKPSPYTPLSTLELGRRLQECLPPGVLNVISGSDPLGRKLAEHPMVQKISFTGSTATGTKVAAAAAAGLKRLTLELGGNDPAIILDDAVPEEIAETLFWGGFRNNGQLCIAVKRVYVPDGLHDRLERALTLVAKRARVGNGVDAGVQLGPLNNAPQRERIEELTADALAKGARIAAGGRRLAGAGYFHEPTIVGDTLDGMALVDEEQFGPVMPLIRYSDLDAAIDAANDTEYGLTASVWSPNVGRATEVGMELECGQVSVNVHGGSTGMDLPFGGHKHSGLGVESGLWGLESYSQLQVLSHPKIIK